MPLDQEYHLGEFLSQEGPRNEQLLQELMIEFPLVWSGKGGPGLAKNQSPVVTELKSWAKPIWLKQYPMRAEAQRDICPHLDRLLQEGILVKCNSPWNTPLLPVLKPGSWEYQLVQDLWEVNKRVDTLHPTIPNPYTLLSLLTLSHAVYTVLDLKDAFFTLRAVEKSQPIFAFEWADPKVGKLDSTRGPSCHKDLRILPPCSTKPTTPTCKAFKKNILR